MNNTVNTKQRIREAAVDVFAIHGFKTATVRQICEKAGANVAAVNYYFKDKQGLYAAVIEDIFSAGFKAYPPDMGLDTDAPPEERLRIYIRAFFFRMIGDKGWMKYGSHARLMVREFAEPTPALDRLVETYIRPQKEILSAIVTELLGPAANTERLTRCTLSVAGQCLHYAVARPIIERVTEGYGPKAEDIDRITDHITRFSLGGIREIREEFTNEKRNVKK